MTKTLFYLQVVLLGNEQSDQNKQGFEKGKVNPVFKIRQTEVGCVRPRGKLTVTKHDQCSSDDEHQRRRRKFLKYQQYVGHIRFYFRQQFQILILIFIRIFYNVCYPNIQIIIVHLILNSLKYVDKSRTLYQKFQKSGKLWNTKTFILRYDSSATLLSEPDVKIPQ